MFADWRRYRKYTIHTNTEQIINAQLAVSTLPVDIDTTLLYKQQLKNQEFSEAHSYIFLVCGILPYTPELFVVSCWFFVLNSSWIY